VSKSLAATQLTAQQKAEFFHKHLPHRLTLLRALRDRRNWGSDWRWIGDIYRSLKDCAIISIRLLLESIGLKGAYDNSKKDYILKEVVSGAQHSDDVRINNLGGQIVSLNTIALDDQRLLAGIYCRASKES
jgi:hypothetical protein